MSAVAARVAATTGVPAWPGAATARPACPLRPVWLRPALVVGLLLAHGAVIAATSWPDAPARAGAPAFEVAIVVAPADAEPQVPPAVAAPMTEAAPAPGAEAAPMEVPAVAAVEMPLELPVETSALPPLSALPPAAETPALALPATPEPAAFDAASPAAAVEPAAPRLAPQPPAPAVARKPPETRPAPRKLAAIDRRAPDAPAQPRPERRLAAARPAPAATATAVRDAQAGAPARPATAAMAAPGAGGGATASYASLVQAELARRKRYPPQAQAAGEEGTVTVSFTIGASGRVSQYAITRSSGHASLDAAVSRMMAAVTLPPPPGGSFQATRMVAFRLD